MAIVSYRCVCGESIELDTTTGGKCVSCERQFNAGIFRDAVAPTISVLDLSDSDAAQMAEPSIEEADDRIGQTLGHYRIVGVLGQGGMGKVYQALDESLQRYVAIKVIEPKNSSTADTKQLQRLFHEAIAQARVNHPNVVHIYYVGRDKDSPFLAMELIGGCTLMDQLNGGPLPYADVIEIALQLADALRHSVNFDIIHGDIKPSNVLLTDTSHVKLSDFGLARRLSQSGEDSHGGGTPDYVAPEIIQGSPSNVQSDLYSLGVTLFEATFGRLPYSYKSSSIVERLTAHQSSPIEFPEPWPNEVPHAWRKVLDKLLAKSPDQRYQTYDEFIAHLRKLRPGNPPKAGRIQRGLAWMVDFLLVQAIFGLLTFPIANEEFRSVFSGRPISVLIIALVGAAAPLLASALQAYWGMTPGKKVFQLRVVDRHGLRPSQSTLAIRMAAQMLIIWSNIVLLALNTTALRPLGMLVVGVLNLAWLVDAAFAFVRRDGRSLHDLLLGTRVVLDARSDPG